MREQNPKKRNVPNRKGDLTMEYSKILRVGLFNILTSTPFFWHYENLTSSQKNDHSFLYNFIGWLIITDIVFYTVHKILHIPTFYKYHTLHHSYKYTYGPSALYASMPEFYIGNLGPNIVSFQMLQLSHFEMLVLIIFQTFYTVIVSHGGYKFSGGGHLKHHLTQGAPYGLLLTDKICDFICE
jgi:sterol desaturase/sphingolipid hydroxylase (fatty acid hydroxylase superfamily)